MPWLPPKTVSSWCCMPAANHTDMWPEATVKMWIVSTSCSAPAVAGTPALPAPPLPLPAQEETLFHREPPSPSAAAAVGKQTASKAASHGEG